MGFGSDGRGAIISETRTQALGALAANVGIFIGTKLAITDDFRMMKSEIQAMIAGLTAIDGAGLSLYLVDGDLSLAEAEAKIELNGPLARDDVIGGEVSMRPVFLIGATEEGDETKTVRTFVDKKTGAPVCLAKPNWTFHDNGKGWNWMVYNSTSVSVASGATVAIASTSWGIWLE